jgi:hypothetical protein
MLKKEQISRIKIYSEEWHRFRIGKLTSSRWHTQMTEKPLDKGALTYLYQKVGEILTGQTSAEESEIENENTVWGLTNEPLATSLFAKIKQVQFITNQNIIFSLDGYLSSTPDAIWIHNESMNQQEYNVSTLEVKCPCQYHRYIKLYECRTPEQLKKYEKMYYWQVLHQMMLCDSAVGYFMAFHPMFPEKSNNRIIQFNKIELWDDFKLMIQRKDAAIKKLTDIISDMR